MPHIEVEPLLIWNNINGQDVLQLITKQPGDFTLYKFKIEDARIDPYYNDISFSFKANCPGDLDCKPPEHECPPDELVDFPIDYLARDFWSYRKALLDFASLRYPDWSDRLEADAGVMMVEVMSALGDEMAYYQDRVSREAYLETATQRRSVRRHARLVDYNMHDGLGANVWLDFTVSPPLVGASNPVTIPFGTPVVSSVNRSSRDELEIGPDVFEVGPGIFELLIADPVLIPPVVDFIRNEFKPHFWDEDQTCLPVGTTELYLEEHHTADLPLNDFPKGKKAGKWVLLKTNPANPDQSARSQFVRLIEITDTTDPVFIKPVTYIRWEQEQALAYEFDMTILTIRGNMVQATAGLTKGVIKKEEVYFIVDKDSSVLNPVELSALEDLSPISTVEREGHDGSLSHLFTLPGSQNQPLVYLGEDPATAEPEITVLQYVSDGSKWNPVIFWNAKRSLLGVNSSHPEDTHFTLDDGTWQRLVGYQRIGEEFEHRDYAFNNGVTICFGDGEFGRSPDKNTLFQVKYRLGGGRRSNVAANSLTKLIPELAFIEAVTNPLPASNGLDAETPTELRQVAPQAFRAITFRAVRPEDYAEAAERLPWVQKAGAAFRWTGSWLTAFVTPDPKGKVVLEEYEHKDLINQLNRFRQAGREVCVMDPEYANMDLEIHICLDSYSYPGEVKGRIFEALLGKTGIRPVAGYFSPDRFTFGTFLERSTLEAAIQDVQGVKAVEQIRFRRRGWFNWRAFSEFSYDPGKNVIIRIENNPLHPERGTLKLYTHGGL
ncbi:MAG: hypothetical protein ABI723_10615 [Bacteroidia bacterium]